MHEQRHNTNTTISLSLYAFVTFCLLGLYKVGSDIGETTLSNCLVLQGKFATSMVSLRRSKLYRLLAGTNILLPVSAFADDGTVLPTYSLNFKSTSVHPVTSYETKQPEENADFKGGLGQAYVPDSGLSVSLKQQNNRQVEGSLSLVQVYKGLPMKRRKQHKRKNVQNQEPCLMRGVYFKNMKWQAAIKVDKKQIHLGTVGSQEEAARLYDRAAFMCGREPNFELPDEDKEELRKYKWDDFLAMTRQAITHKKSRRRVRAESLKKSEPSTLENDSDSKQEEEDNDLSGSEDAEPEISES